jgi:hypothetical protein
VWPAPGSGPAWHLAPDGECGAVTAMAACNNGPTSCNYVFAGAEETFFVLTSPKFYLEGNGPYVLDFDYRKVTDGLPDKATVWLLDDGGNGIITPIAINLPDSPGVSHVSVVMNLDEWWWGNDVKLELILEADTAGNGGAGWLVDNIVVKNDGGWTDVGLAKPGSAGTPELTGTGLLTAGSSNQLALADAAPSSSAVLVFGLNAVWAPFKGGTLVPHPLMLLPLSTNPAGDALLPFVMPPGVSPGTKLYFQIWISDPGASAGFSSSNGVLGWTG